MVERIGHWCQWAGDGKSRHIIGNVSLLMGNVYSQSLWVAQWCIVIIKDSVDHFERYVLCILYDLQSLGSSYEICGGQCSSNGEFCLSTLAVFLGKLSPKIIIKSGPLMFHTRLSLPPMFVMNPNGQHNKTTRVLGWYFTSEPDFESGSLVFEGCSVTVHITLHVLILRCDATWACCRWYKFFREIYCLHLQDCVGVVPTSPHDVTTQKNNIDIFTTVETSNHTTYLDFSNYNRWYGD
jgi:hypothetical protein